MEFSSGMKTKSTLPSKVPVVRLSPAPSLALWVALYLCITVCPAM